MSSSSAFDFLFGFFEVVGSNLSSRSKATLVSLAGARGTKDSADSNAEVAEDEKGWNVNSLGAVARPLLPSSDDDGAPLAASGIGVRVGDEIVPLAFHDPRIDKAFPNGLARGTTGVAGYGKTFHLQSLVDPTNPASTGIHVIYAPYQFVDGVPQKAHVIMVDTTPGSESLQLVHADGAVFSLLPNKVIQAAVDNSTGFQLAPDAFSVQAKNILLVGNVCLGGTAGVPLLAGAASPPSTRVFIAP